MSNSSTKVARHVYRINRNVSKDNVLVTETSKKVLSIVYREFGHNWFTRKTVWNWNGGEVTYNFYSHASCEA